MRKIRLCVEINKGRIGVPLQKLAKIAEEIQKFLGCLCNDVDIRIDSKTWVATDFQNGSVNFDIESAQKIDGKKADHFEHAYKRIIDPKHAADLAEISSKDTLLQYAKITSHIDTDEVVSFGIYGQDEKEAPELYPHSKARADELKIACDELCDTIEYYGDIGGTLHSWHLNGNPPCFRMREIISGELIDCYYDKKLHNNVHSIFKTPKAVVYVHGLIKADALTKKIKEITVVEFHIAEEFSDEDFNRFFGCAPDLTGNLTTKEYRDSIWRDER